jgi:hypothetical protein
MPITPAWFCATTRGGKAAVPDFVGSIGMPSTRTASTIAGTIKFVVRLTRGNTPPSGSE